jgi:hypothetical protein
MVIGGLEMLTGESFIGEGHGSGLRHSYQIRRGLSGPNRLKVFALSWPTGVRLVREL